MEMAHGCVLAVFSPSFERFQERRDGFIVNLSCQLSFANRYESVNANQFDACPLSFCLLSQSQSFIRFVPCPFDASLSNQSGTVRPEFRLEDRSGCLFYFRNIVFGVTKIFLKLL